ncbi:hypothetical protein VUR80DRAFT_6736 [Thermomyces stellatus]
MATSLPKMKVLRTEADWPVWINQVNARMLTLYLREFISINEDGVFELNPPKPPMRASDGGPSARRVRVPAGHDGMLQRPQDGEYMDYIRKKNEYLGFMLEVQRSISRDLGFDVEKECGFGELVRELKAHLALNKSVAAAPADKPLRKWKNLKLVKAYLSARKSGKDYVAGWNPHTTFVMCINKHYPNLAASIYTHLDQLRQKHGLTPQPNTFRKLVKFGVRIVVSLGEGAESESILQETPAKSSWDARSKASLPSVVIDLQDDTRDEEPQQEVKSNTLKRKRNEETPRGDASGEPTRKNIQDASLDRDSLVFNSPETPGLFVRGTTPGVSRDEVQSQVTRRPYSWAQQSRGRSRPTERGARQVQGLDAGE